MSYWFLRFVAFLIRIMPIKIAYWLGLRICDLMFYFNREGRRATRENIRIIFKHQGIQPSRHILDGYARKTFQYFGKYLADFIRFRKLTSENVQERISFQGLEHIEAIRNSKRGAIMATAHFGNWELGGAFIAATGIPISAVVRPVPSPALDRLFHFFREERGLKVIPLANAGMGVIRALKRGEVVGLVSDRDYSGNGYPHTFFGRETSLPRGAAWFALRTGVPIYMAFAIRAADDTFILRVHPPIDPKEFTSEEEIETQIIAVMEETIAADPCQWFVFHNFWPDESAHTSPLADTPAGTLVKPES